MKKTSFTRIELYNLVWEEPLTHIAKKYQITDSGIRKICKKKDIPLPPLGYWQKKQYNKTVPKKTKLPSHNDKNLITLHDYNESKRTEFLIRKNEIESEKNLPRKVPKKLTNPHTLTIKTRSYRS